MPRALAPGLLLFIWSLLRAQACFLHEKQMEEQNRAKATKPFWVSIVLPAWGGRVRANRALCQSPWLHEGGAHLQAKDFGSLQQHSQLELPRGSGAPVSITMQHHHASPWWLHKTSKYQFSPFLQTRRPWAQWAAHVQGLTSSPIARRAGLVPSAAQQLCSSLDYP